MSEKLPESKPILMPRSNGNIEVWHRTGMLDGHGNHEVISQVPEKLDDEMTIVKNYVPQELFDSYMQDDLANELGMDRPTLTPEQLDRHFKADKDLGEVSLSAVDVVSPDVASKPTHIDHLNNLLRTREETVETKNQREVGELANFITGIMVRSARGEVMSFDGKTIYRPEDLNRILNDFVEELDEGTIDSTRLLKLIPRSDGLRDAVEEAIKNGSSDVLKKAIAASRVESPDVAADQESQESKEDVSESQTEVERIEEALHEAGANLPEQDRTAAWQYAIALYPHEESAALKRMSTETKDSRAYMPYVRLFKQLQDAREKAKK